MGWIDKHWAANLKCGDRCTATLRHETDFAKNKHNVLVIVESVNESDTSIKGHTEYGSFKIPFNELKKI